MMRTLSKTTGILLGIMVLCSIPSHAQIVSYLDSSGKRVFINAEPAPSPRKARGSLAGVNAGVEARETQFLYREPVPISAADMANRAKVEVMIREVSARYQVDPALVRSVMETESNWNSRAVSSKGALGLMQLVPATARQLGVRNAFDPKQNLEGGVRYLHMLLERYNGDLDKSLAAYNAGPGAVDRAGGVPRYRETRQYVQKVTDSYYRPSSNRLPHAYDAPRPIYRMVNDEGRAVFTNE